MNKDYLNNLDKDELIKIILDKSNKEFNELENFSGLKWERNDIEVIENNKGIPKLEYIEDLSINPQYNNCNFLFEGENLKLLQIMQYTHRGKIDVIYIDPPYNTTKKDFKYNDDYVDKNNKFRHSKWLNFMKARLDLAKKLMSKDGMLAVSIDDNEMPRLALLMEEIFGASNIKIICVKMAEPSGMKMTAVARNKSIAKLKEYVIIAKNNGICNLNLSEPKEDWDKEYNLFLKGLTLEDRGRINSIKANELRTEDDLKELEDIFNKIEMVSLNEYMSSLNIPTEKELEFKYDNAWRIVRTTAFSVDIKKIADMTRDNFKSDLMYVVSPKNILYICKSKYNVEKYRPRGFVLFADDYLMKHLGDFWSDIKTTGLDSEGGVTFRNGKKPLKLLKRIINMCPKKDALVFDFFAGSASLGQAVLELNREQFDSKRRFILCTNNEVNMTLSKDSTNEDKRIIRYIKDNNLEKGMPEFEQFGICRRYAHKRLTNITKENESILYFKIDNLDIAKEDVSKDYVKQLVAKNCTEIVCFKEFINGAVTYSNEWSLTSNNNAILGVYWGLNEYWLSEEYKMILKSNVPKKIIYKLNFEDCSDFIDENDVQIKSIPIEYLQNIKKFL